jgi:hypothetical protein
MEELVGLKEDAARSKCKQRGFEMRIIEKDGKRFLGSMEYREDRINVTIRNGRVKKVHEIG